MPIEFEHLPINWGNPGIEPSEEYKAAGYAPGDKPPAGYFNWALRNQSESLREMQERVQIMYNTFPQATKSNMTLYVSTAGNDTTGDGTSAKPYRTIQYAVNTVPKLILHNVIIYVTAGTYSENVIINGFSGGHLHIIGYTSVSYTYYTSYVISGYIQIVGCSTYINIQGFRLRGSIARTTFLIAQPILNVNAVIMIQNSSFVTISMYSNDSGTRLAGILSYASNVVVNGSYIVSKNWGIVPAYGSSLYVNSMVVSGNTHDIDTVASSVRLPSSPSAMGFSVTKEQGGTVTYTAGTFA